MAGRTGRGEPGVVELAAGVSPAADVDHAPRAVGIEQPALGSTAGVRAIARVGVALQLTLDEQRLIMWVPEPPLRPGAGSALGVVEQHVVSRGAGLADDRPEPAGVAASFPRSLLPHGCVVVAEDQKTLGSLESSMPNKVEPLRPVPAM